MQQIATLRRTDVFQPRADGAGVPDVGVSAHEKRSDITIEVVGGERLPTLVEDWRDLVARADVPNVFMDPRVLAAAAAQAHVTVLLAWHMQRGTRVLVGIWGFSAGQPRRSALPLTVLRAPAAAHAYLASPVIDRDHLDDTLEGMLDVVSQATDLPKLMTLDAMRSEGETFSALLRVVARRGARVCAFGSVQRPILVSKLDGDAYLQKAFSSSSRKKLRQYRRRLGEKGRLEMHILRTSDDVRRAFEDFLALEAAGWKGRRASAILSSGADAALARGVIAALAETGDAVIHTLELNGRPISMQIVLYAGNAAFTWKTAYDETLAELSPGTLLFEDYTKAFLADPAIATVDSCAHDDSGYMGAWMEREALADIWLDARRGGSASFEVAVTVEKVYRTLREKLKNVYLHSRALQRLRDAIAATRQFAGKRGANPAAVTRKA